MEGVDATASMAAAAGIQYNCRTVIAVNRVDFKAMMAAENSFCFSRGAKVCARLHYRPFGG